MKANKRVIASRSDHASHAAELNVLSGIPDDDFVVSRHATGKIVSRYGDMAWDWTPYNPRGRRSMLNFCFWVGGTITEARVALLNELRWLMYLAIWRRQGPPLSYQSLAHYLKLGRKLARHCAARKMRIRDLLASKEQLIEFAVTKDGFTKKGLASLLSMLSTLDIKVIGFQVPGGDVHKKLREDATRYANNLKQHPPIPTRIYSHLITTLTQEISDFEKVLERYFALVDICQSNPSIGRSIGRQFVIAKTQGTKRSKEHDLFETLIKQYQLDGYFQAKQLQRSIKGLSKGIYQLQTAIRLTIQLFTGMRSDEVSSLPLECLTITKRQGRQYYVVSGTTTKLNNGHAKRAKWVTNAEGAHAIQLAQTIAKFIARTIGATDIQSSIPLFLSTVNLRLGNGQSRGKTLIPSKFDLKKSAHLRTRLQLPITAADLSELERIDPHRAWCSEEKFKIGHPWVLTSHQLRRSLALYAQRSGLVSLPSLRRQLQHITEDMARYYAKGSAFARDFIGEDKKHFGFEWQEAQPVSSALSYILNVLLSDDVLFGGHGNWVDNRLRGQDGEIIVDRAITIQQFKRGELAYRETPLGGCTNTENCDKIAIKWLDVECISGCKNLIGRLPKLERVIAAQTKLLGTLSPDSIEYRSEKADLDVLVSTRDKIRKKTSSKEHM